MHKITVSSFLEALDTEEFALKLHHAVKTSFERKLSAYVQHKNEISRDVSLTQERIRVMKLPMDRIESLFPFHYSNIKAQFVIEDLIHIITEKLSSVDVKEYIEQTRNVILDDTRGMASIIGMDDVKNDIVRRIYAFVQGMNCEGMFHNVLMLGPSGCGKTSMATVMARLFSSCGMLATDVIRMASPHDVIAQYVGQSAARMRDALMASLEGIFFLDESHQLASSTYGDESLTEMIYFIQKYADLCMVTMAGYKRKMYTELLSKNEGVDRRFPIRYVFKSQPPDALMCIFEKELKVRTSIHLSERQRKTIITHLTSNRITPGFVVNVARKISLSLYSFKDAPDVVWDKRWKKETRSQMESSYAELQRSLRCNTSMKRKTSSKDETSNYKEPGKRLLYEDSDSEASE